MAMEWFSSNISIQLAALARSAHVFGMHLE